jgi:CheY-like chemotaxis protein
VDGSTTRLTVADTGHGIAPAFLPAVFERFKQADASSSRRHGGLGIGLALVKDLVEMHGGTVSVASDGVGLGATFTVVLPSRASFGIPVLAETAIAEFPAATGSLSGVRVIIVDNDEDALEILMQTLTDAGAVVAAVSSTAEALTTISTVNDDERPHVVVAEVGLPAGDGYMLLRQVRALPEQLGGRLPAVAVSAFATMQERKRALNAGFKDHIAKPFAPQLLLAAIANAVASGPMDRRRTAPNGSGKRDGLPAEQDGGPSEN